MTPAATAAPPSLATLIAELQDPAAYPHPVTRPIGVRQTHISVVFLTGERVYKVKKPVDLGFVDYHTLERRRRFCEAEVRLNRRLAPDVYLGLAPIGRSADGRLHVGATGGAGPAVEWAVVMQQLPFAATLADRLERGDLPPDWPVTVASRLAAFHAAAEPAPAGSGFGTAAAVGRALTDCLTAITAAGADGVVDPADAVCLDAAARTALAEAAPWIDARVEAGRVRACHGDLRLDHVYWRPELPPPRDWCVIDGIEFNDALRYLDPVADIAFLVMDLGVHAYPAAAARFADAWFAAAGDPDGRRLLPLYETYRAAVRAKVETIRAREAEVPAEARARSRERARRHVAYALRVLRRG